MIAGLLQQDSDRWRRLRTAGRSPSWMAWVGLIALLCVGLAVLSRSPDLRALPGWAPPPGVDSAAAFRQHWMERTYQNQASALADMRAQLDAARRSGDRHAAWMLLAWLVRTTSVFDVAAARALHAQAEAEIARAEAAGDRIAAFELALMVEAMGVQQFDRAPNPQRLQRLEQLAAQMHSPLHEGLLDKLRGMLASQAGEDGEALFRYERALAQLAGPIERAEVRILMAIALVDNPSASATQLAIAYLDDAVRSFPPERYPGLLTPVIRLSLLHSRAGRPVQALALAQRALQVAQRSGLRSELARAHVARGQALLTAGEHRLALADFQAAPLTALPVGYQLQAVAGRALCLARLADPQARSALQAARELGFAPERAGKAGLAQFHDTLSTAWHALGDDESALHELSTATALRRTLAVAGQERLGRARDESFALSARSTVHAARRPWLYATTALLAVAACAGFIVCRRQRRRHQAAQRDDVAQQALHQELLQLQDVHARRLDAACAALRRPAQALTWLARRDGVPDSPRDAQTRHFQEVRHGSQALLDILDPLLDMVRLRDGSYVPHPERIDVAPLLAELDRAFAPQAARLGLQWELRAEPCGVITDRHLLRHTLNILLTHVLHHARSGKVCVRLQPMAHRHGLEIACSDPGATWPAAPLPAAPDAPVAPALLGLGPEEAQLACDLLGHPLTVVHSPVFGLTLRIDLPHALAPSQAPSPNRPLAPGRSVALVEDDAFSRITLMNALVDAGLEVQAYASFTELMAPTPGQAHAVPEVLISDLHLGDYGDATDALRQLRRRPEWRDVPVLMLTGDIRDEVSTLATELGVALAYKPISVRRLIDRIALLRSPQPLPARPRSAARDDLPLPVEG